MSASSRASSMGILAIALTLLGWSSVPLFLRHFAEAIDAWTSNGWRYGFSALLWLPVVLVAVYRRRLPARLFRAAVVPSIVNSMAQVCFTWAHYKIEPGLLTFGLRSQMIFVAVGAYLLFPGERPIIRSRGYLWGLVALMAGTTVAVSLGEEPLRGAHAFGVTLSILSGMLFACYGMAVRKYMDGYPSVLSFAAISQYTAAAMVVMMLVIGQDAGAGALRMPGDQFGLLLLSAFIGIAMGHVLYYMSIARLGVAVSSGVLQLHPFFVAIGSLLLFRERLTGWQWLGGGVAVGGALMMLAVQRRIATAMEVEKSSIARSHAGGDSTGSNSSREKREKSRSSVTR